MRFHGLVHPAALMALAVSSVLASAQFAQFQKPTDDELKMTSDPKAPGAAAIYLDLEENAVDELHTQNVYARIKVLTEKGKQLATVSIRYGGMYQIKAIKGRTIHPDGTVYPLDVKPEDLLISESGDSRYGKKVFTLPNVEVGSILEYRFDIQYPDGHYSSPLWEIQRDYFVRRAHYSFAPFRGFMRGTQNETSMYLTNSRGERLDTLLWWANLPGGSKVQEDGLGRYSIDVSDIPPRPDEAWMPPIDSLLYKVSFYYRASVDSKKFWEAEGKQWSKDVDHFADVSGTIKNAAAGLVTGTDTDLVKAKKLYDAVQALENTDYTRQKSESEMKQLKIKDAKRAEDVWKQKSGDSEDIALLYLAMLRGAGVHGAYALKVVNRGRALFDQTYLSMDQFDDTLVLVDIAGQQMLLDPGEKMCPFQKISWRHALAGGIRQMPDGGAAYVITPDEDYVNNTTSRLGEVTIDEHSAVSGTITYTMTGQEALYWRQVAIRNDEAELKKRFDRDIEGEIPDGVEAHVDHFTGLDQPDSNLVATVKVSGSTGVATARRLLLPGFFLESRGHEPFVNEEKRLVPVDMHYAGRVTDQVTYHFPIGLTVEGAPADTNFTWPQRATYLVRTKTAPGSITVARSVAHAFTMVKPEDYQELRGFYQKVATSDEQQLVLRAATEQKAE